MITLITGAPGCGKSAALVDLLSKLAKGRALYVNGIPDLVVPHFDLEDVHKWPEVVPDGAAVVLDEVQTHWRPRGPGQKVPVDIAALETHRHRGLDFFIVTQHPGLLDRNVRALVGRHVHLRDVGVLGRHWYEWPECSENVAWKTAPLRKRYKLPKDAFKLYKSASVHIKPIRTFPIAVVFGGLAVVACLFFGWKVFGLVKGKLGGEKSPAAAVAAVSPASGASAASSGRAGVRYSYRSIPAAEFERQAVPVVANRPETAPMYDELRKVVRMPRIMGGYCQGGECRCYMQEGLRAPISMQACYDWVRTPRFDPYYAPAQSQQVSSPSSPASQPPAAQQGLS